MIPMKDPLGNTGLLNHINSPVIFMGLQARHGVLALGLIAICCVISILMAFLVVLLLVPILGRLAREHKKGNPDHLSALLRSFPSQITVEDHLGWLGYLERKPAGDEA